MDTVRAERRTGFRQEIRRSTRTVISALIVARSLPASTAPLINTRLVDVDRHPGANSFRDRARFDPVVRMAGPPPIRAL